MGDQKKSSDTESSSSAEDRATIEARKAKKYIINKELVAKLAKKRKDDPHRARRYRINTGLLEANGKPGAGSKIIDLSINGAQLELPFAPPFMSQMTLKFKLEGAPEVLRVVGRVLWSRTALQRGWYEVEVQFYQNYWEIDHFLRLHYKERQGNKEQGKL